MNKLIITLVMSSIFMMSCTIDFRDPNSEEARVEKQLTFHKS